MVSNTNIGENPMACKPKGSFARFVHGGLARNPFFGSTEGELAQKLNRSQDAVERWWPTQLGAIHLVASFI